MISLNSDQQEVSTDTPRSYPIDRKKFQKRVKREPIGSCFEAYEVKSEDYRKPLPFISDKVRVGIGGEELTVLLVNGDYPVTYRNVADGEVLEISIIAVHDSDCDNIVIMK